MLIVRFLVRVVSEAGKASFRIWYVSRQAIEYEWFRGQVELKVVDWNKLATIS